MAGDHDDGGVRCLDGARLDDVQPADVTDAKIDDDQLWGLGFDSGETIRARQAGENGVADRAAEFAHQLQDGAFVIYDNYFGHNDFPG